MQKMCVLMLTHRCNLDCIYCYQEFKSAKDMSLETAKSAIENEVKQARDSNNEEGLRVDLFGGEPLLRFEMIKELCKWVWETINDVTVDIYITTNGTLIDDEIKEWLRLNKDKIHIIMSVDGNDNIQECNRGCHSSELPINFVIDTMPQKILSMTVSRKTLHTFADEVITFHERGYEIDGKLAQGEVWQPGDGKIYEAQLEKVAQYYLENPQPKPLYFFKEVNFIHLLNNEPNEKYAKPCGIIEEIVAYNVDGKLYPCHHFLPNVHGNENILEELNKIDFNDSKPFIDEECMKCDILKLCRTCCARNYNERGSLGIRDKRTCQLRLAEAKVISSYQIRKYMSNKDNLTDRELLTLKAAIKCYQLCCDFEEKFYS